ncbi:S-layer homology domain-containing protein [Planococcus sp. 1R117A]|uniref:S-layer homology domain-containing protein n=1 Tax=Planococcus sp. 1R117A TaxID=3447020 RepID=UPI003EDBB46C
MKKLMTPIAIVLALFLLVSSVQAAPDLPKNHRYYEEIQYLMKKGIINEESDGKVRPNAAITRAEVAVMIGRLKGLDGKKRDTKFKDVKKSHYASGYIAAVDKAGYLKGYKDGTYRPNQTINRGDAALIISRVFDLAFTFNNEFKDVRPDTALSEAIAKVLAANITIGYPDNTFRPKAKVTRGEFAAFIARGLEPKFKNDAVIKNSYQKDKTKTYAYARPDGSTEVHRFVNVPKRDGLTFGFMWTVKVGNDVYEYMEFENYKLFAFAYPYSEYDLALAYPVKVGQKFNTGLGDETLINTITGVNKTVKTRYKTFTNATEVTTKTGFKYYMAPGFATIKSIDEKGRVVFELTSVK